MRATKPSFAMTSAVLRPCLAFRSFHCEAAVPPARGPISVPPRPKGVQAILYDQYDNNAGVATLSATFTDFPNSSSDLADDFVVPGGQTWNVDSIDADGVYFNGAGPATDWNVFIYTDNAGLPGTQIFSATNIPIVEVGTTFTANLTPAAVLGAGTYWIEIQANMTFGTQGEWGWSDRTVQSNEGAAFRNPGGDFGCGTDWVRKPVCVPTTGGPDQVYRINGTTGGGGTPSPTPTGTPGGNCGDYTFALGTATFVPGVDDIGLDCDDCGVDVVLPFPVHLYDQDFTQVHVGSNGHATFGNVRRQFWNHLLAFRNRRHDLRAGTFLGRPDCVRCGRTRSLHHHNRQRAQPDLLYRVAHVLLRRG